MALTRTVLDALTRILGPDGVISSPEGRLVYECDMQTFYKGAPDVVALPESAEQVEAIVRLCRRERVPVVPRGSGSGLIGGAMAPAGGVMVGLNRMDRILEVDLPNRCATVQPGLVNLWLTRAVEDRGYFFAPDPSSQMVSSIGGKVADRPGYDLTGTAVGAEGTFGLVTAITVRLLHAAEAVKTVLASFPSIEHASEAVSGIIAAGIIPAALEMLDALMIQAIEAGIGAGYPKGAAAICRERGALDVRVARDEAERALLWKGRKEAAGALGRLAPMYMLQDAVVPRSKLPAIMREILAISERHGVQIANVFHAGDGNLHPLILYDDRHPEQVERARAANEEVLHACIAMGGTVTGEHGVGLDKAQKLPLQYADAGLNFMYRLRGVFDPDRLMNPGKLLPSHPACGEGFRPARPRLPDGAWI